MLELALFIFVMAITPGPTNLLVSASGLTFGVRRTLPHIVGSGVGFSVILFICGFGLGVAIKEVPRMELAMVLVANAYLMYLVWRIARASLVAPQIPGQRRPMSFLEAALFQMVNPKGWAMALTAATAFGRAFEAPLAWGVALAAIGFVVDTPCVGVWAVFGAAIAARLSDERQLRAVNLVLALVLFLTIPLSVSAYL